MTMHFICQKNVSCEMGDEMVNKIGVLRVDGQNILFYIVH